MDSLARLGSDFRPIKLAKVDEMKISAIIKATKEFIVEKLTGLVEKDKLPKANADYLKKMYFDEVYNCKMDIKHAFIVSNGLIYPLLKAIGNCVLRAIFANDKKLMLVEALAVFEENINIIFQGGEVERDFIDIMNQSGNEKFEKNFVFRNSVSNSALAKDLENSGFDESSRIAEKSSNN
ncbi:MAG: hypothetical protein J6J23_04100 [Clostridia bacterium]|nr:hypothetical protein [Clostridia bacterium]